MKTYTCIVTSKEVDEGKMEGGTAQPSAHEVVMVFTGEHHFCLVNDDLKLVGGR